MAEKTLIESIREALDEELARDSRVFITGEDVGPRGGVFRATLGLFARYGPTRIIDSPLAELSIVAVGIGAAMNGMRPICEIQFADFIQPAYNQIVNEAARMYYRTGGTYTVPLVIRAPYGGGIGGGLYHSQSIEATYAHVPGLKVVVPSNPYDAKGLLKSAVRDNNPVLFLEAKKGYRLIYAYGMMHYYCQQAAEEVAKDGIEAELVDLRTLNPLDKDTVLKSFQKTGKALIVYEDNRFLGYGAEIAAILADEGFRCGTCRIYQCDRLSRLRDAGRHCAVRARLHAHQRRAGLQ